MSSRLAEMSFICLTNIGDFFQGPRENTREELSGFGFCFISDFDICPTKGLLVNRLNGNRLTWLECWFIKASPLSALQAVVFTWVQVSKSIAIKSIGYSMSNRNKNSSCGFSKLSNSKNGERLKHSTTVSSNVSILSGKVNIYSH